MKQATPMPVAPGRREWEQKRWTTLSLLTVLPIVLFLLTDRTVDIYDGGLSLSMALRFFYGQMPNRDFYFQYGPMHLFVYALLFKLFGVSLLPIRIFEVVLRAVTAAIAYCLLRRVTGQAVALLGSAMMVMLTTYSIASSGQDAVLATLLCGVIATPVLIAVPSPRRSLLYGLACGLVTLFRYEQGPMLLAIYGIMMGAGFMLWPSSIQHRLRNAVLSVLWAVGGFFIVALPILLWLRHAHALADFRYQCFTFARQYYYAARHLPYFPPMHPRQFDQAVVYLPLLAVPVALVVLLQTFRSSRRDLSSARGGCLLFLTLLTLLYLAKGMVRKDFVQLLPAIAAASLLVCVAASAAVRWTRSIALGLVTATAVCLLWYAKGLERASQKQHLLVAQRLFHGAPAEGDAEWCRVPSPMTRGFCFSMDADHRTVVKHLLEAGLRPGDPLFVGLPRHDIVYANDNLLYFAAGAVPAVKWALFDPDLETREDIQREMIATMEARPPLFAVTTTVYADHHEPNDSSISSGVTLLDRYLATHYRPVETVGVLSVYRRR